MLAVRDQENLATSHQHGAAIKQQQGQASRQLGSKTPGAKYSRTPMKVPLNDENGAQSMTSKVLKGGDKSTFVTPMTQRARAVLGDKTTNAKTKGLQTVNGKSAITIEQSQAKPQNTVRPKQREPQAETQRLQVHVEETDPSSEDDIEYCPPRLTSLPYKSNIFPSGVLTFDALKPENMMKGYYRYYFNPIDENGISKHDRDLQAESRKAIEEGERKIKEDLDEFEWSIKGDLEPEAKAVKKTSASTKLPVPRRPLSTIRSRDAANVLSMDDTTKSLQRKTAKPSGIGRPVHKKATSLSIPAFRTRRPAGPQLPSIPKKSATELEATSRTTIGYNRGRATASLLAKTKTTGYVGKSTLSSASNPTHGGRGIPRSNTTLSNDSDKTITPALYAHRQTPDMAADDDGSGGVNDDVVADDGDGADGGYDDDDDSVWRRRVPFLSIFNPDLCGVEDEQDDDDDDPLCIRSNVPAFPEDDKNDGDNDDDGNEFELQLD